MDESSFRAFRTPVRFGAAVLHARSIRRVRQVFRFRGGELRLSRVGRVTASTAKQPRCQVARNAPGSRISIATSARATARERLQGAIAHQTVLREGSPRTTPKVAMAVGIDEVFERLGADRVDFGHALDRAVVLAEAGPLRRPGGRRLPRPVRQEGIGNPPSRRSKPARGAAFVSSRERGQPVWVALQPRQEQPITRKTPPRFLAAGSFDQRCARRSDVVVGLLADH